MWNVEVWYEMWKYGVNYGIVLWTRKVYCGSMAWNVEVMVWNVEVKCEYVSVVWNVGV